MKQRKLISFLFVLMCLALLVVIKGPPIISDMSGLIWMGIFYLGIFLIGSFFAKKRGRMEHTEDILLAGRSLPCLLYTSPSPRDVEESRMPSSA